MSQEPVPPNRTPYGACPNCGQDEIIRVPSDPSGPAANLVRVGMMRTVPVARLICLACGFVREWIDDRVHLELLRKKYGEQQPPN